MNWQAGMWGALAAIFFTSLIALVVKEVRKGPGNRRTGLPPPADACRRSADWRTSELKSPRGYVP